MRKRILSVLLTIAMLMSVVSPTYVFAETGDAISFRLEASEVDENNEVTVKLYADKNDGVVGFQAIVSIDANTFEIDEDSEWYDMPNSLLKTDVHSVNLSPDKSVLSFIVAHRKTISTTGELLWFKMKVKNTATSGKKTISFITTGDAVTKYVVIVDDVETGFEVASLTNTSVTISIPVTGITISGDDSITGIGSTTQLTVAAQPANANQPKADMSNVAWRTSNDKVATVENGLVTAVGEGTATITATFEGKTASKDIKVSKAIIDGKVNVPTKAVYGQMIEASYSGNAVSEQGDIIRITWYRGETVIETSHQYTPTADDVGKEIYVVVTSDKFNGKIESAKIKVEKATQEAPAAFKIKYEDNKIKVINPDKNAQYKLNNGAFGTATEFDADYDTEYTVSARYPETATHKASAIVTSNTVTTPKAPRNLTVTASAGGSVSGIPKGTVREGDKVTLTAKPGDFDHRFVKWEGVDGLGVNADDAAITFTMGSTDVTVKAVFAEKEAVPVGFGADKTFTYNGEPQAPTYGPDSYDNMSVKVEYFARGGNVALEGGKPTNAGKYTMRVTYTPDNANSECRTTVATCDFEIIKANQAAPAVPTATGINSYGFKVENFVENQQYAINTTGKEPTDTEWKNGSEFTNSVEGLEPATDYYVFTRKAGSLNYNPSPSAKTVVKTLDTYKWEVEGSGVVGENVRVGGTLPESLTGTIKNIGTGTITNIKATLSGENVDKFTLGAVSAELASNGTLNITVKLQGITTDNKGNYNVDVTVTADGVEDKIITFVINVVEKDPVIIKGIDDKTVTFNGKTQGIDLSNANISGDAVDASKLTVTYTKDGVTVAEPRDAGTYKVAISYEDENRIGGNVAQLIINKQDVTLTGLTVDNKDYKGDKVAHVHYDKATLKDKIEGTDVNFDMTGIVFEFEDKNVGENKTVTNTKPITLTGADANNYNLKNPTVELKGTITPRSITVNVTVDEKIYDGSTDATPQVHVSAPQIIENDDVQFIKVTGTYVTADAGDAVEVIVSYQTAGNDANNYNFEIADKAYGKVEKRKLTVTLTAPADVIYDGKTHGVSGVEVEEGRVAADNGKTLYTLTYDNKDALPVDAGTYSATAKLTAEGSKNYKLTANTVDVKIKEADMTATDKGYSVAFMLAGAQTRPLSELQLTPANVSGEWSVVTGTNEILDGEAKIDGENLVFTIKSGLKTSDIGKKAELTLTFTPDKNYNTVTATVTVTLAQDTYTNSLVGTLPTQVKLGDKLDLSGVKLVTKFGSGAPDQTLDVTDAAKVEMTTTYDAAATGEAALGAKTVTFTDKANSGITYTHTFTVVDVLEGVKLEADQVAYSYKLKEVTSIGFDGKIHAVYKSGARKALTHADVVLSMSDGTAVDSAKEARLLNTLGTTTITLTYTEKYFDGTTDKQSVDITVSVTADPVKPDGKPNAEGFAVTPIPDAGKEMEYKDGAGNKVEPENVQGKLADAAPGTLEEEVKKNPAFNNVGNGDVVYENISFEDNTGKPVTFANGKMQVTVPYPADSDKGDEFVVLIPDGEGKMKAIVPQKTADGLQFEIENSDVTFAIGWYTPAPSPVLPTEPERDPEDNFWNEVYWTLLRSGQGSVITANAGYYDRVPQGVLRAVDISGNTLVINSAFGMQVVVNPGALEKLGMYRIFYPISYLKEMLKGSSVISGSGTTGITVGVLMPTTGDATVVEHPYSMTPATAGIIPGLESAANARPVIDNADGVSVLDGAQRNDGAVIGGGMLIGLGLLALLGAAYVTMRKRGN